MQFTFNVKKTFCVPRSMQIPSSSVVGLTVIPANGFFSTIKNSILIRGDPNLKGKSGSTPRTIVVDPSATVIVLCVIVSPTNDGR